MLSLAKMVYVIIHLMHWFIYFSTHIKWYAKFFYHIWIRLVARNTDDMIWLFLNFHFIAADVDIAIPNHQD